MKHITIIIFTLLSATLAFSQTKIDQERMDRDIEIAENALATLIKQKFDKRNVWLEVKASYTPGYGVTMRLPNSNNTWGYEYNLKAGTTTWASPTAIGMGNGVIVYGRSDGEKSPTKDKDNEKEIEKALERTQSSIDSIRTAYYAKIIEASKEFIADYGDLLSQLPAEEKILITNRGDGVRFYSDFSKSQKRMLVTIEGTKGDIAQLKQGKITRDQMMGKIKVVNTESTNEGGIDLELLSSILSRLYRSDLSKTFYTEDNIYYERLKNFGVIYYMSAYSSNEQYRKIDRNSENTTKDEGKIWSMPTQRLEGLTQEQRDKKVIELYPQFEKDLKDNIVEYAQTVKSLKDDEMFVFNVTITKCVGCNIPSNLELSLKNSMVRKLAAGQATKADVVAAINVKRGPNQ